MACRHRVGTAVLAGTVLGAPTWPSLWPQTTPPASPSVPALSLTTPAESAGQVRTAPVGYPTRYPAMRVCTVSCTGYPHPVGRVTQGITVTVTPHRRIHPIGYAQPGITAPSSPRPRHPVVRVPCLIPWVTLLAATALPAPQGIIVRVQEIPTLQDPVPQGSTVRLIRIRPPQPCLTVPSVTTVQGALVSLCPVQQDSTRTMRDNTAAKTVQRKGKLYSYFKDNCLVIACQLLNPSNAEVTFQSTRMQRFLKTIYYPVILVFIHYR